MLSDLTTKKNIRTFSVSPENLTGEKGKGGMLDDMKNIAQKLKELTEN